MYSLNLREEELKNKVAKDFFENFDTTRIVGNVDFCVCYNEINYLFCEAKAGICDNLASLVQLILTLGKNRICDTILPPAFLGAFNAKEILFCEYNAIMEIFSTNDMNWKIAPSNHKSPEFIKLYSDLKKADFVSYSFLWEQKGLKDFIKANFVLDNKNVKKLEITKNNFKYCFDCWCKDVKNSISVDWNSEGILEADFYLADLLSENNSTKAIKDSLRILLENDKYKYGESYSQAGRLNIQEINFKDNQKAHKKFWSIYKRPPKEEFWNYILERRDLLVPLDIRERKGAFFTPQIWVRKAQEYLERALGENWQDEYYIWDCAAGTGNLLANLINARNLFASTLDLSDVNIMKELARDKKLNLLENHIFQFDFLNDSFDKLPARLNEIIKNQREKLIIFINPPYAEATSSFTTAQDAQNRHKAGVARGNKIALKYKDKLGKANNELFAQFFARIYFELPSCILASFSKMKYINAQNFREFREFFNAQFLDGFICPAFSFDNVKGDFPIGFLIWDLKGEKNDNHSKKCG